MKDVELIVINYRLEVFLLQKLGKKELLLEIFSIIFAVFFALWIDEVRESRRLYQLSELQQERLIEEIRSNSAELTATIKSNATALKKLETFQFRQEADGWKSVSINTTAIGWEINSADLKDSAWQTTLLTNITSVIPSSFLSDAAEIYRVQKLHDEFAMDLLKNYGRDTAGLWVDVKTGIKQHIYNKGVYLGIAGQLIERYKKFLEKHQTFPIKGVMNKQTK